MWEIKCLRAIALWAHECQLMARGNVGGSDLVLNAWRREVEGFREQAGQKVRVPLMGRFRRYAHCILA